MFEQVRVAVAKFVLLLPSYYRLAQRGSSIKLLVSPAQRRSEKVRLSTLYMWLFSVVVIVDVLSK